MNMKYYFEDICILPRGWASAKVGELYKIVGGGTPATKNPEYWIGDIPWITSADIHGLFDIRPRRHINIQAIGSSATNLVPKDSIIVVTRVGLGKVALADKPLCFSQDAQALIKLFEGLYPKYVLYFLSEAVKEFKYKHRGTTIAGVTKKQLAELPVLIPPLNEQHRIVAKIEELFTQLDAGVEALKRVKVKLKRYRQAVLKAAFEGRLTEKWREEQFDSNVSISRVSERYAQASSFELDTLGLSRLPKAWNVSSIGEVYKIIGGGTPDTKINKYWTGDIPWITSADIRGLSDVRSRKRITREAISNSAANEVPPNSIIVATRVGLGKIGIVTESICFSQDCQALVGADGVLDPWYSLYFLSRAVQIFKYRNRGTTIAGVTKQQLAELKIAIPCMREQKVIVGHIRHHFSLASKMEIIVNQNTNRAMKLRQCILKSALSGRIVPQNPADEPAEKLLARIKLYKAQINSVRASINVKAKGRN